jgi:tetratricopeptide (TPR) repeat protein
MLVRGNLRWDSELRQQIESLPAAALASESDRMAWHWLQVNGLIADGRYAQLAKLLDDILPAARRLENPSRLSHMVLVRALSRPYTVGSPSRAEFEEALSLERSTSDPVGLGYVLSHFGIFLSVDGDVTRARALHEEMLPIARSLADDNQRAEAHYDLATDDLAVGNAEAAYPHLAVAARHYQDIDHRDGLARCLGALSGLALERNHSDLAAWLVGATAAARDNIGLVPWPLVDEAERRVIARVRAQLDAGEFTAHVANGRAHETGEALAQALSVLESPVPAETW